MKCPICHDEHYTSWIDWPYNICGSCQTIYARESIDHLVVTENDQPESRNTEGLFRERLARASRACPVPILDTVDFGEGKGEFRDFMWEQGIGGVGIDEQSSVQLKDLWEGYAEAVFMIEVIEHLENPLTTLKEIARVLGEGCVLYLETGFSDDMPEPKGHPYVNPKIGHRTVLSRKALKMLAKQAGFEEPDWINATSVVMRKS